MKKKEKKYQNIILSALNLFAKKGFYNTPMVDIAKNIGISVGSIYTYFPSKKKLARASIIFVINRLADDLKDINNKDISQAKKIELFVECYLNFTQKSPEMIDYFFRVYLSNREFFCEDEECGFALAKTFTDEINRLVLDGISNGEFKEQNLNMSFSVITGILGAITFLNGEDVLDKDINSYSNDITLAILNVLR